ncbi:MAG TPA: molybdenum cofactor guanylyltransferase [Kofleriaceae bacterium]
MIVAGGKATRLGGIAKHELVVGGETIFARQVRVLAPLVAEIIVSGATVAGYRTVHDSVADAGPLAGIAAGLAATRTPWLLAVACDMPHLTRALIEQLIALASDGVDAVGVRVRGRPEPLLSVLHVRARSAVERRLSAQHFKVSGILTDEGLRVAWLDDPDPHALVNINSPADLRES